MGQWDKIKVEEDLAECEFRERLKEQGFDDEDIGEPFMKWLEKDLVRQTKESLSTRTSPGTHAQKGPRADSIESSSQGDMESDPRKNI